MQVIIIVVKLEHQHILWMGIAYRERKLAYVTVASTGQSIDEQAVINTTSNRYGIRLIILSLQSDNHYARLKND